MKSVQSALRLRGRTIVPGVGDGYAVKKSLLVFRGGITLEWGLKTAV